MSRPEVLHGAHPDLPGGRSFIMSPEAEQARRRYGERIARTLGYFGPTHSDVTDHDSASDAPDLMADFEDK
ncbi:MAG: hypothetical protein PHO92_01235 [Candidatus Peribacteraceae bacterium]|nr:hypothetical protein [Candidatus Peribacteraceae bacterium]